MNNLYRGYLSGQVREVMSISLQHLNPKSKNNISDIKYK